MRMNGLRLLAIAATVVSAAMSVAQNQANFAPATDLARAAAPGFMYRVDLKTTLTGKFYWEYRIAQANFVDSQVRVSVNPLAVTRNRVVSTNENAPRSGSIDPVAAGNAAVAAAAPAYGSTQVVRFEARLRSDGSLRYRVLLNVLGDDGGALDQDLDVTLDGAGRVIKIRRNDD